MKKLSHREFQLMLWKNAFSNEIPISNLFELTPLCNLDCRMCYVHLQDPSLKDRMLNGNQWIRIMDEAISLGMMSAILTGGEAMTHPDFRLIYRHLSDRGISVSVKSNGILLNESAREFFQKLPPATIDISVYGCSKESYQAVTAHDCFETVDRNIRAAIAEGLPIRLMITPSRFMDPWIDEILEYAQQFEVKTVVNTQLFDPHPGTGREKESFDLSKEKILAVRRMAKKLFEDDRLSFEEEQQLREKYRPDITGEKKGLRCAAGRTQFAVTWDGVMIPCVAFPRELISSSVLEEGTEAAWNAVHEAVLQFQLPKDCAACGYSGICSYCPASHGNAAVRHQCNPAVCELERALIDEARREKGDRV